jgi:hypothetical protein
MYAKAKMTIAGQLYLGNNVLRKSLLKAQGSAQFSRYCVQVIV